MFSQVCDRPDHAYRPTLIIADAHTSVEHPEILATFIANSIFAFVTISMTLEMFSQSVLVTLEILGMDTLVPIPVSNCLFIAYQTEDLLHTNGCVERRFFDEPFVNALGDCVFDQGVAGFTFFERNLNSLARGNINTDE